MIGKFDNIKIQGMASAVPEYVEENGNFEHILGARRTKKQIRLTGVSKRHVAGRHQRTSDLCYAAAVPLMKKLNWKSDEIKVLIYITQGPNYKLPSTAFFLQHRLGIPKDCVCFDINLGCSSFNAGVHVVSALLQSCDVSGKALLLIGDTASQILHPEEVMTEDAIAGRMIFGAAGAAIAIEKVKNGDLKFMTKSDGNGFEAIIRHHRGRLLDESTTMDGTAVFEFAINDVSDDVKTFKNFFNLREEDIDYYIFHQAQKLILDNIAACCDLPDGKELRSLGEYGNTSGTSVPVTVCANRDKFADKEAVRLFLCGFGVGLSWGTILTEIPTENILPIIETNEHYDEDKIPGGILGAANVLVTGADRPLGESITRYLNDNSANVILAGTDKDKLYEIQEDLFLESHCVAKPEEDDSIFVSVSRYCSEKALQLDGIVFTDMVAKPDFFIDACLELQREDVLKPGLSIVLVSDAEECEKVDLEKVIQQIQEHFKSDGIRVNVVEYDKEKLDLTPIKGNWQDWIEKYLQENCPAEMNRPLIIGKALTYLLSDDSQYTSGTTIFINR